jgi:putative hydrolase of the HAD superfamily
VRDNLLADRSLYCNEVFSRCCAIYEAEKVRVLEPYPGARETLAELKRQGFPLAVVTDAHNGNALARLRKTGLDGYFDYIISFDMTGAKKPAPDAFLLALRKLGTLPSETLLVGDSIRRDIAPARHLGMMTAYAKYGDRNVRGRDPPDCRPDYVLGAIRELLGVVQGTIFE